MYTQTCILTQANTLITLNFACYLYKKPVNSGNIQDENSLDDLRKLRLTNVNKVIIANVNISLTRSRRPY